LFDFTRSQPTRIGGGIDEKLRLNYLPDVLAIRELIELIIELRQWFRSETAWRWSAVRKSFKLSDMEEFESDHALRTAIWKLVLAYTYYLGLLGLLRVFYPGYFDGFPVLATNLVLLANACLLFPTALVCKITDRLHSNSGRTFYEWSTMVFLHSSNVVCLFTIPNILAILIEIYDGESHGHRDVPEIVADILSGGPLLYAIVGFIAVDAITYVGNIKHMMNIGWLQLVGYFLIYPLFWVTFKYPVIWVFYRAESGLLVKDSWFTRLGQWSDTIKLF